MSVRSRFVVGFCGLALSVPAAVPAWAAPQDGQPGGPMASAPSAGGSPVLTLQQESEVQPSPGSMPHAMAGPSSMGMPAGMAGPAEMNGTANAAATPAHHHHGILGRRHCVECQRARARAVDGIDVPPPPGYAGATVLAPGERIVSGPTIVSERVVAVEDPQAPGHAVVGGEETAGYAVVNGQGPAAEPTPIGLARGATAATAAADPRMAQALRRPGSSPFDPAVMPTSGGSIPPAPAAMAGPGHDRPHIISHVFGLPKLGHFHQEHEDKRRQQHAAISYGDGSKVNELPASMVYGRQ